LTYYIHFLYNTLTQAKSLNILSHVSRKSNQKGKCHMKPTTTGGPGKHSRHLHVLLTPRQFADLREASRSCDMTMSLYARAAIHRAARATLAALDASTSTTKEIEP